MINDFKKPQFHVLALTKEMQATLRFCLWHYTIQRVGLVMNALKQQPTNSAINEAMQLVISQMRYYDELGAELAGLTNWWKSNKKNGVFHFHAEVMPIIKRSVDTYNDELYFEILDAKDYRVVKSNIEPLHKLIVESLKYTYSLDEIRNKLK